MERPQHHHSSDSKTWDELLSFRYFQGLPTTRGYGYGGKIKDIREKEFSRIRDITYLDNVGTTLFPKSLVENFMKDLTGNVYCNPHSQNASSMLSNDAIERVRSRILQHFNTTAEDYTVIFTSGSTAAIKLVAESFPWTSPDSRQPGSCFSYLTDNHTSVVGMRMIAAAKKVSVVAVRPEEMQFLETSQTPSEEPLRPTSHLFCYPAQSNYTGTKYPLTWIEKIKTGNLRPSLPGSWYVLLDAASYVSTSPLDLSAYQADFVPVSFYKIFGFPTGLGALLVSNKIAPFLQKTFFGGGTVAAYLADEGLCFLKDSISDRFEDGTVSFLDIVALGHGFDVLERLTGGMRNIQEHTFSLGCYAYKVLSALQYANGTPVLRIYGSQQFKSLDVQGPVINFNIQDENGDVIGYTQFDKLASLNHIHVRTGCFCNAGCCQLHMKLSCEDVTRNYEAGHICGDDMDVIDGRPTGSVRMSFGYMSTFEDAQTFLKFIINTFIKRSSRLNPHAGHPTTTEHAIPGSLSPVTDRSSKEILKNAKPCSDPISSHNGAWKNSILDRNNNLNLQPSKQTVSVTPATTTATKEGATPITLTHIYIYPIASCAALEVSEWPVVSLGLLYDRNWMIVNPFGVCLSQKQEPRLSQISPSIDLARGIMVIKAKGMDPIEIPLPEARGKQNNSSSSRVCEDKTQTHDCGDRIAEWMSLFLDRPCRLIRQTSNCQRNAINKEKKGSTTTALSMVNKGQCLLINTASILQLRQQISQSSNITGLEERFPLKELVPLFQSNLVISSSKAFEEEGWSEISIGAIRFQVLRKCTKYQIICTAQQTGQQSSEFLQVLDSCKDGKDSFGMYLQNRAIGSSESAVLSVGCKVVPVKEMDTEIQYASTNHLKKA
ncbi:molybdenum cofactor sulfurase-like [Lissotriton helveticus]